MASSGISFPLLDKGRLCPQLEVVRTLVSFYRQASMELPEGIEQVWEVIAGGLEVQWAVE